MCNLNSHTSNVQAIIDLARATINLAGNLAPQTGIFPDNSAPIVRTGADGQLEIAVARWGMPSSRKALLDAATKRANALRAKGKDVDFQELLRLEPDIGTPNIRNTASPHWKPWLGPNDHGLVPFTSLSEYDTDDIRLIHAESSGNLWCAPDPCSAAGAWPARWPVPGRAADAARQSHRRRMRADNLSRPCCAVAGMTRWQRVSNRLGNG